MTFHPFQVRTPISRLLFVLLLALASMPVPGVSMFERWKSHVPFRTSWGPYRIAIDRIGKDDDGGWQRLRIMNSRGRTLREVRAWAITKVSSIRLLGPSKTEIEIALWSGGAYASFTRVYFSRRARLRNLLVFNGGSLDVREIRDLNRDGIPEIVVESPVLLDFSGYHFHRPYPVIAIYGWDGSRYVDVTRRFPRQSQSEASSRLREIVNILKSPPVEREWDLQDKIAAYYANMLAIGRGTSARLWLRPRLYSAAA